MASVSIRQWVNMNIVPQVSIQWHWMVRMELWCLMMMMNEPSMIGMAYLESVKVSVTIMTKKEQNRGSLCLPTHQVSLIEQVWNHQREVVAWWQQQQLSWLWWHKRFGLNWNLCHPCQWQLISFSFPMEATSPNFYEGWSTYTAKDKYWDTHIFHSSKMFSVQSGLLRLCRTLGQEFGRLPKRTDNLWTAGGLRWSY